MTVHYSRWVSHGLPPRAPKVDLPDTASRRADRRECQAVSRHFPPDLFPDLLLPLYAAAGGKNRAADRNPDPWDRAVLVERHNPGRVGLLGGQSQRGRNHRGRILLGDRLGSARRISFAAKREFIFECDLLWSSRSQCRSHRGKSGRRGGASRRRRTATLGISRRSEHRLPELVSFPPDLLGKLHAGNEFGNEFRWLRFEVNERLLLQSDGLALSELPEHNAGRFDHDLARTEFGRGQRGAPNWRQSGAMELRYGPARRFEKRTWISNRSPGWKIRLYPSGIAAVAFSPMETYVPKSAWTIPITRKVLRQAPAELACLATLGSIVRRWRRKLKFVRRPWIAFSKSRCSITGTNMSLNHGGLSLRDWRQ